MQTEFQHFAVVFVLLLTSNVCLEVVKATRPNIVLIVADDLGWNDVGFHGSEIKTPNIDKLAYDGVILNNYYVSPICTPTRGSLMTGRHPIHLGLQHGVIRAPEPWGLPLNHSTMANHLKFLGYSTHIVGKWHLGFFRKEYLPTSRGFDSHFGYWTGREDYFDHLDFDITVQDSSLANVRACCTISPFSYESADKLMNMEPCNSDPWLNGVDFLLSMHESVLHNQSKINMLNK